MTQDDKDHKEELELDGDPEVYMSDVKDEVQWVASVPAKDRKTKMHTAKIKTGISVDKATAKIDAQKAIDESLEEIDHKKKPTARIQEVDKN